MSANDNIFNQFNRSGRITPEAPGSNLPSAGVPLEVPVVQVPNTVPRGFDNLASTGAVARLAQMAGYGDAILQGQMKKFDEHKKAKKNLDDANAFGSGLTEGAKIAAKSRDTMSALSQLGAIPAQKNPWFRMGAESVLLGEHSSRYRNELVQARLQNPLATPEELQDGIKGKYAEQLAGFNPAMASEYFFKSASQADEDDRKLHDKYQSENFTNTVGAAVGADFHSVFSSELALVNSGSKTFGESLPVIQSSIQSTMEKHLATGMPYAPVAENAIRSATAIASQQEGLSKKLSVLDSLDGLRGPTGAPIFSNPELAEKKMKARKELIELANTEENIRVNEDKTRATRNKSAFIKKLGDIKAGGLPLPSEREATKMAIMMDVDPEDAQKILGSFTSEETPTASKEYGNNFKTSMIKNLNSPNPNFLLLRQQALEARDNNKISFEDLNWVNTKIDAEEDGRKSTAAWGVVEKSGYKDMLKRANLSQTNPYLKSGLAGSQDSRFDTIEEVQRALLDAVATDMRGELLPIAQQEADPNSVMLTAQQLGPKYVAEVERRWALINKTPGAAYDIILDGSVSVETEKKEAYKQQTQRTTLIRGDAPQGQKPNQQKPSSTSKPTTTPKPQPQESSSQQKSQSMSPRDRYNSEGRFGRGADYQKWVRLLSTRTPNHAPLTKEQIARAHKKGALWAWMQKQQP